MKKFDIQKSIEILERTPGVLRAYLEGLSAEWIFNNEGPETWSPYHILGHLIHGEKTDWIERMNIILSQSEVREFTPFDRFAQMNWDESITIEELLIEFETLRSKNIEILRSKNISSDQFELTAIHPSLGQVSLRELLSTWVVHDLGHIGQISRVMAKQYSDQVGPWKTFLRVLN